MNITESTAVSTDRPTFLPLMGKTVKNFDAQKCKDQILDPEEICRPTLRARYRGMISWRSP